MSNSKTGLTSSSVKCIRHESKRRTSFELSLSQCSFAKPVQFSLRPFGGLYNPYASSCSILCNHPGPNEVKTVLKQVKEQYIEAKSFHFKDDRPCSQQHRDDDYETLHADPDRIPDEFYQRFTGSDSRPLTPTPTVASQRTRGSVGSQLVFHTRRCLTPDPVNSSCVGERKQIILDLRRSHSQETLFWNASSELSVPPSTTTALKLSAKETRTASPSLGPTKNMRLCEQEAARKRSAEQKKAQEMEAKAAATTTIVCIHDRSDGNDGEDDADGMKRRGKKKRKSKLSSSNTFHMSQEPETLIATLGPDSPNQSARPSLVPAHPINATNHSNSIGNQPKNGKYLQSTFITEDALKLLRRGLNIDIVENAFERFMNQALKEALRTIPIDQIDAESTALRAFKETIGTDGTVDNEKWLKMPRKYTRSSARFSLPINTNDLARLTPFTYLSRHVWISNHRKQLYRFVFNKYICEVATQPINTSSQEIDVAADDTRSILFETPSDDSNKTMPFVDVKECTMSAQSLNDALIDVLGFPVDAISNTIDEIRDMLDLNGELEFIYLTFRNWCGIVAFAERYLNSMPMDVDPCDEVNGKLSFIHLQPSYPYPPYINLFLFYDGAQVEIADFESLERRFAYVRVSDKLKFILNFIKYNGSNSVAMAHKNDNDSKTNCPENDTKIIIAASVPTSSIANNRRQSLCEQKQMEMEKNKNEPK